MIDINKLSKRNVEKLKIVLEIILDELEIQGIKGWVGNKISLQKFEREGLSYQDVVGILYFIAGGKTTLFKIGNEEINRKIEEKARTSYIFNSTLISGIDKKEAARRKVLGDLHLTEEYLKDNLLIRLEDNQSIKKLRSILKLIIRQVEEGQLGKKEVQLGFYFDGLTFKIKKPDGQFGSINFYTKNKKPAAAFYLLSALAEILKSEGFWDKEWFRVYASRKKITERIKTLEPHLSIDENWIRFTRNNLNLRVPPDIKNRIEIGNFDTTHKAYPFSLKLMF